MRILVLAYAVSDHRGGGEAIAACELVRGLGEVGVDVDVVTPDFSVETPLPDRVRVHRVAPDVRPGHTGLNKARMVRAAKRLLRERRYDAVHSVSQWTSWPILARPFVVTGCYRPYSLADAAGPKRPGGAARALRALAAAPRREAASRAFEMGRSAYEERVRGRDLAWTLANADHRIVRQSAGVEHYARYGPTTYIPVGADTAFFTPGADGEKRAVVAYAGHLQPYKHPVNLVEAVASLVGEGLDVRLEMTGRGPEEARVRARAAELGIADRVTLHGHVPREALRAMLRRAAVFCLPSADEPGGAANVEAMACGTAVVCSRTIVAARDYVQEGVNGHLTESNAPVALAKALRGPVSDLALAARMGAAARRTAERYPWREIARRHVALYESL